jgi:hypothetical protein
MKIITIISIITIVYNLAQHLVSVLCAFEAQVPKNVVHKMQHLLVEKKKIREFLPIRVHAPGKDCITARRAWSTPRVALLTR